ncbi:MAG: tRNA glutamyl-Q(34) synthetase GluQRS [Bacteroides sp.]|nr:tRNA glutamyl-Q(34) synthetase GluQRS [Bacteroides sp.]MCM1379725.1 tRNA glutamyl-Q(34) synthetase GluQRS [Bacteroides sp.]MCM1446080.1 tRNA glutamyl-Q(34) synthetase GluQRS [Prevotella sp.]
MIKAVTVGRFAPSPTGRMHLGNVYAALQSWLSVRRCDGRWILRIEDLDPQRSRREFAEQLEDDLRWLGLIWDEGGLDNIGPHGPYVQSQRNEIYEAALQRLRQTGLTYGCTCSRADIIASSAPHQSDGRVIYGGRCRPAQLPFFTPEPKARHAVRIFAPARDLCFTDRNFGPQRVNLARDCGDFVLRRADGAWAYQLAVVVDDALMGVTEVVRGEDLLLSAAQQIYLFELLGYNPPEYAHIPLLRNERGERLAKRDASQNLAALRPTLSPEEVVAKVLSGKDFEDYLRFRDLR